MAGSCGTGQLRVSVCDTQLLCAAAAITSGILLEPQWLREPGAVLSSFIAEQPCRPHPASAHPHAASRTCPEASPDTPRWTRKNCRRPARVSPLDAGAHTARQLGVGIKAGPSLVERADAQGSGSGLPGSRVGGQRALKTLGN